MLIRSRLFLFFCLFLFSCCGIISLSPPYVDKNISLLYLGASRGKASFDVVRSSAHSFTAPFCLFCVFVGRIFLLVFGVLASFMGTILTILIIFCCFDHLP